MERYTLQHDLSAGRGGKDGKLMGTRAIFAGAVIATGLASTLTCLAAAYRGTSSPGSGAQILNIQIPVSLKREHEELHAELVKATQAGGKTGQAAREVAKLLHPHFVKEEEFALPPLGLLPDLARGKVTLEMRAVLPYTDQLKAELPSMREEHRAVIAALRDLTTAASEEQEEEAAHFAQKLMLHAQTEEQVIYPAAILVGEYLQLRLHRDGTGTARSE
jgi:hypothetical protein